MIPDGRCPYTTVAAAAGHWQKINWRIPLPLPHIIVDRFHEFPLICISECDRRFICVHLDFVLFRRPNKHRESSRPLRISCLARIATWNEAYNAMGNHSNSIQWCSYQINYHTLSSGTSDRIDLEIILNPPLNACLGVRPEPTSQPRQTVTSCSTRNIHFYDYFIFLLSSEQSTHTTHTYKGMLACTGNE